MKTYHLKDILKKDLLIVELPENGYYEEYRDGIEVRDFLTDEVLTLANYILLGSPDEIKDDDAINLVGEGFNISANKKVFNDYKDDCNCFKTALESFNSALEKEILWENPYGKEPIENLQSSTFGGEKTIIHRNPMNILWHEAQEKTFDKKREKIFVKN